MKRQLILGFILFFYAHGVKSQTIEIVSQLYTDNPHYIYKKTKTSALQTLYHSESVVFTKTESPGLACKEIRFKEVEEIWNDTVLSFKEKVKSKKYSYSISMSQFDQLKYFLLNAPDTCKTGLWVHQSHYYPTIWIILTEGTDTVSYVRGISNGNKVQWHRKKGTGPEYISSNRVTNSIIRLLPEKFLNRKLLEEEIKQNSD